MHLIGSWMSMLFAANTGMSSSETKVLSFLFAMMVMGAFKGRSKGPRTPAGGEQNQGP